MIVIVDHTVMDGQVARIYASAAQADRGNAAVSASRNAVMGHGTPIERDMFEVAWALHEALKRTGADVREAATHRREFGGQIVPIPRSSEGVDRG